MKTALIFILALFVSHTSLADCASSGIQVFPTSKTLKKNSLIFIQGYYFSQDVIKGFGTTYSAYLVAKNHKVELEPVKTYKGMMHLTLAVMRPKSELKAGATYELKIASSDGSDDQSPQRYIDGKWKSVEWKVLDKTDSTRPKWTTQPKHRDNSWVGFGCGPAVNAHFTAAVEDNSETYVIVELTDLSTKHTPSYLVKVDDGIISLGHGMCSGAFTFNKKGNYKARFKLYDICGNENENWSEWIECGNPHKDGMDY